MNNIQKIIKPFVELNNFLLSDSLEDISHYAYLKNNWFIPENTKVSLRSIATQFLEPTKLTDWLEKYNLDERTISPQKVGVVMAGNIPAVGFHDALCVLGSGHTLLAKLSSDDTVLMQFLLQKLAEFEPDLRPRIELVERINAADAYIATGSDNTARYFEYYFSKKPHIIRRNRTAIGIINGNETTDDLAALGKDILQYFGLGCRNVSKLYIPENYDFKSFYETIEPWGDICVHHHKYFNNYEYKKSIYLVNGEPHLDNGFLILHESENLVSPISVVYYQTYQNISNLEADLTSLSDKIQCIVSANGWFKNSIPFGTTQIPSLTDYADGIDTMQFLVNL